MSIPGLGQIPAQPVASSPKRTIVLQPGWEWRFSIPFGTTVSVKLQSGTAERDGVELAPRNAYVFGGSRSHLLSWHGCELEIDGHCDESVAEYPIPADNPANALVNLHTQLNGLRAAAARERREGPRVLVAGARATGKTTVAKMLAGYATRQGHQPLVVNMDPEDGMLTLPGALSAGVFATVMDPESVDGWGATPTSAPSSVPVKLPIVHFYGRRSPVEDAEFYRELTGRLAGTVSGRLSEDDHVRSSGVIVDTAAVSEGEGVDLLAHIVDEMSVNIVVVLGSSSVGAEIFKKLAGEKTSLGEPVQVVQLDQSSGAVVRDENFAERVREAAIKEYFFGDRRRTLSPQIQQIGFDGVIIYKMSDYAGHDGRHELVQEEPSTLMQHWTLAIMHASIRDPPDVVRASSVMGYVYVSDVDEERRKIKLLAPVGGRLGDRPLVLGRWPEPYINLLG